MLLTTSFKGKYLNKMSEGGLALIVMGPCACGKSEVASALAKHYECEYIDADSLHPESNIKKMSDGIPLTDDDRFPWLKTVREHLVMAYRHSVDKKSENNAIKVRVVVACSSLKRIYRDILRGTYAGFEDDFGSKLKTNFVFLNCSESVLVERIARREGHFMKGNMLQSQLSTLEKPGTNERAIYVNGDQNLSTIISDVVGHLNNSTVDN